MPQTQIIIQVRQPKRLKERAESESKTLSALTYTKALNPEP